MNQPLLHYAYLQVLDLMTTTAFLLNGIREMNPLVRAALKYGPTPLAGLLLVKLAAIGLGVYCWRCGHLKLLGRMNVLFALVVAWNMAALIAGSLERL